MLGTEKVTNLNFGEEYSQAVVQFVARIPPLFLLIGCPLLSGIRGAGISK
jgi:hypothetical protein